ncbi:MAG TPA: M48 family metallopeptidase, partial [Gemmataceae bacterium]|nr:M48 family metallopeptidase [Gemmataceae bacterium]
MSKGLKITIFVGASAFLLLFLVTTFAPPSRAAAEEYFTAKEIDNGLEFGLQRRLLYWASAGLHLAALVLIVFTGFARKLADLFASWVGGRWLVTVLLVGGFCFLVEEAISLPIGLARLELVRAWGLTKRPVADWLADHAIGLAISGVIGAVTLLGLYLLIRYFPRTWWALATIGTMLLAIGYIFIMPIVISPLFNTFTPLTETQWADLQAPMKELASRAGVPVKEILVVDASRQGSHTNAYFTGFGSTQRIVLYDNLLKKHKREEVESILAHEMGHWQHNHIVKGTAMAALAVLVGFFLLAGILRWAVNRPPFLLKTPFDPAGVPLILLLVTVGEWLVSPVQNAISRHFERQADMVSLELT